MSQKLVQKVLNFDYKLHLVVGFCARLALIAYGIYHDQISTVPYTDVDYKVFTDASRHVIEGKSPYDRHTYRYTPLLAFILIPNILLHHTFGKILFSVVDLIDAFLIKLIVEKTLVDYEIHKLKSGKYVRNEAPEIVTNRTRKKSRAKSANKFEKANNFDPITNLSMIVWLYNPMILAISSRGSCDSIAVFFVLTSLYFLQCKQNYLISGVIHGISIHFRLYPIMYSLTFFMYLSTYSVYSIEDRRKKSDESSEEMAAPFMINDGRIIQSDVSTNEHQQRKTIFKKQYLLYLVPNGDQIQLISSCLISISMLTGLFHYLYGYKFLYETYIFHLVRKDTRHNFSLFFYLQYLTAWIKNVGLWQKILTILPQLVLLLVFSFRYGLNRFSLNFSVLTQTIVMVTYNSVLTSQYFVWILALLPLCLWQIKISARNALIMVVVWFFAQGTWLLPAYFLEFHGQNTFLFIWIQSVSFFCANIAILGRLIMNFTPIREKLC